MRCAALALLIACSGGEAPSVPVAPAPSAAPRSPGTVVPEVAWRLPERDARTPAPLAPSDDVAATRALLAEVVRVYALDPENPWAVAHGLLALGPDLTLTNGVSAVDFLFAEYAQEVTVGDASLLRFPTARGAIRIEPHTDLLLKSFAAAGLSPEREVVAAEKPHRLGDLYRGALARTWVDGARVSASGAWNDTPWTLQGLATWAPSELAWTADGHEMTLDGLTHAVVVKLDAEYAFIRKALAEGGTFEKRGQGIFAYTCGGAHLLQGAAYAVARGFGEEGDRATVQAQIPALYARVDVELAQVDAALRARPDYTVILLVQRLKFLGHFLETAHTLAALGLYTPDAAQRAKLDQAAAQLVATVAVIHQGKLFERLPELRAKDEQVYLDLVGDAAHALRGLDLALGESGVRY